MNEILREIEYAGYLLGDSLDYIERHPQFGHLDYPPKGYVFTQNPSSIETVDSLLLTAIIDELDIGSPPPKTNHPVVDHAAAELFKVAENAVKYGASINDIREFLRTRNIKQNMRLPDSTQLAFIPTFPLSVCSTPWAVEIEDSITLFYPYLANGRTASLEVFNLTCYPVVKALLESDMCKALITHMRSTAENLGILFASEIIQRKVVYAPLGVKLPDISTRKSSTDGDSLNLLFTNSWHQDPYSFYIRGGHDVLEAFSILVEKYPNLNLIIRSTVPELSAKHAALVASHPRVKLLQQFLPADDLHRLMLNTDIYLIPAARVHVVSVLQAMSYGIPVVASDGWGFSEYVDHGVNGMVVAGRYGKCSWMDHDTGILREDYWSISTPDGITPQIVDGLVEALSQLVEDVELRRRLSWQARVDTETKFTVEQWNRVLGACFDKIFDFGSLAAEASAGRANVRGLSRKVMSANHRLSPKFGQEHSADNWHDGGRRLSYRAQPLLLEEGYKGFNIVHYESRYYGLSQALGVINIARIRDYTFKDYQRRGLCFIGTSVEEVKQLILQANPVPPKPAVSGDRGLNVEGSDHEDIDPSLPEEELSQTYIRKLGLPDLGLLKGMPDFLTISSAKTGTTWLFENLRCHPQIFLPEQKELQYFTFYWQRYDISWYLKHFQNGIGLTKGEISPGYGNLPYFVLRLLYRLSPSLKLIYLMRQPVERTWSQVKHLYRTPGYLFDIDDGESHSRDDLDRTLLELIEPSTHVSNDYLTDIKRWLSIFPKQQLYVGFYESIQDDPIKLLTEVFDHLGVSAIADWSEFPISSIINATVEKTIPDSLKSALNALYKQPVCELAEFLKTQFNLDLPSEWLSIVQEPAVPERNIPPSESDLSTLLQTTYNDYLSLDREWWLRSAIMTPAPAIMHPVLVEAGYQGFNLVTYRGKVYGLAQSLGDLDLTRLDAPTLNTYQDRGECVIGTSLEEAKRLIAQVGPAWPELIEAGYQGFNLVAYRRKVYGLALLLGHLDITRLDDPTLRAHQEQGLCFIGRSMEEVKQLIRQDYPWRELGLDLRDVNPINSMIGTDESFYLHWLSREYYRGAGEIIDSGPLLGGSTYALASGLQKNNNVSNKTKRIYSYDLFRFFAGFTASVLPEAKFKEGDSLLPLFLQNTRPYQDLIKVYAGDLLKKRWTGQPVEILFVDVAKSWKLHNHIIKEFFGCLIPNRSIVIYQDYYQYYCYWIHITMRYLSPYFEVVHRPNGGSLGFMLTKELPSTLLKVDYSTFFTKAQAIALMDQALLSLQGTHKLIVMTAKVRLLCDYREYERARSISQEIRQSPDWQDWLLYDVVQSEQDIPAHILSPGLQKRHLLAGFSRNYNLFKHNQWMYAVPVSVPQFDITNEKDRNSPGILRAKTLSEARELIGEAIQPRSAFSD